MATDRIAISDTEYTLITAASDSIVQNTSGRRARVVYSDTLPLVGHVDFHVLKPNKILNKAGSLLAGNIYARMSDSGSTGFITVT